MVRSLVGPTINQEVHEYVQQCVECQVSLILPHTSLFQVSIAPTWSNNILWNT